MAVIKIDEAFIGTVRDVLLGVRNQISVVRGGVNPGDEAHPHGHPLNALSVVPGGKNFQAGVNLKSKITTIGTQVDGKLGAFDGKLDTYSQRLDQILESGDEVELTNMSLADYGSITAPPTTV